jgi:hypothetical protein
MNANKRDYLIAAAVLILVAAILIYVNIPVKKQENLIAKVRYFDGSLDTIRIVGYEPMGGSLWLKAEDGHIAVIGANNVIIVEDEGFWEGN